MSHENDEMRPFILQHEAYLKEIRRQESVQALEKKSAWEYITHVYCDDTRVQEHIAIPGYN